MDFKQFIKWSLRYWWVYVLSVMVCVSLAILARFSIAPQHEVSASMMIRTADGNSQQNEMLGFMGVEGSAQTEDEIEVLLSRTLLEQVVRELQLAVVVKQKKGLCWMPLYPCPEFAQVDEYPLVKPVKRSMEIDGEKYQVVVMPIDMRVDQLIKELQVAPLSDESKVIVISTESNNPLQARAMINRIVELYEEHANKDKNRVAMQTKEVLDTRIAIVESEIQDVSNQLKEYKSRYQITDIEQMGEVYQKRMTTLQQQLLAINVELGDITTLENQMSGSVNASQPHVIYADSVSPVISKLVAKYNEAVINQSGSHVLLGQELRTCLEQAKKSKTNRRSHIQSEIKACAESIILLSQHEHVCSELARALEAKEEQYDYLVGKREENAISLGAASVATKRVDDAKISSLVAFPRLSHLGIVAILVGMLIPFLIYAVKAFIKEYC